jgi:hypothetical protein
MQQFERIAAEVTGGRTLAAIVHAGVDKDAKLKTWLTGVPLDEAILTLSVYR